MGGLERARTRLVECDLIGRCWVGYSTLPVVTEDRGVVGERNPETVSERIHDEVADAVKRSNLCFWPLFQE